MTKNGKSCHFFNQAREKIWMIMRLCVIFVVFLSFTTYGKSSGQEQTVTLKLNQVSYYELFDAIRLQTGLRFLYNADQMKQMSVLDVNVKNKKVCDVLKDVLTGTPLTYVYDKEVIMLIKRTDAQAQQQKMIQIRGLVTDQKKYPLPGVTIMVKGLTIGTATDKDGKYRFTVPQMENLTLVYSFIGMVPVEVKYAGKDTINVVMKEEVSTLDEVQVVATGYQSLDRKDVVASYKTVKASDIMMPAYSSIDQMLQGQVAGMIVMNTGGRVGNTPKIQIRGTSTLLGNTAPLWVVDGIIQPDPIKMNATAQMTEDLSTIIGNQISWLNPQNIETITVLKDASATAVYGSKASNGVIVVTTKKGKADRLTVNYTGNFSFKSRPTYDQFNVMNSQERVMFSDEALDWGAFYAFTPIKQTGTYEGAYRMFLEGDMGESEFLKQKQYLESVNTNWLKLLTQNAFSHNHNVSLYGGSEKFTYNVSLGYNDEKGQEIGNESERYTARIAFDAQLRNNIRISVSANGTSTKTLGFGPGTSPLSYALNTSRAIPAYDENGDFWFYQKKTTYTYNDKVQSLGFNIINERENGSATIRDFFVNTSLDFKWDITDWLAYQFTGGYNRTSKDNEVYSGERTFYTTKEYRGYDYGTKTVSDPEYKAAVLPNGGTLYTNNIVQAAYNIQNKILISKAFNPENRLNVMLGMEVRSARDMGLENMLWGYLPGRGHKLARPNLGSDFVPMSSSSGNVLGPLEAIYNDGKPSWSKKDVESNYFSWFATLAYSLKNRYVFNANIRNDASNAFGQDVSKRLDPTYSFGVSWRVSEEAFVQENLSWLNELVLRATYGVQGNTLTENTSELVLSTGGFDSNFKEYYSKIKSIPNPYLTWERTKSWNFGLDLEIFRMFNVTAEYYRRSSNAIIDQAIPYEYGRTLMDLNGGWIYNSGMEFTVAFTPIKRKDFALSVSLNSSKNWNKTGEALRTYTATAIVSPNSKRIYQEGYPVGSFWSYDFTGLNPKDGTPLFNFTDFPADQRDPNINLLDFMVHSGQNTPYFTGGLNFGIRYKTLSLSSNFSLLLGAKKRLPSPFSGFSTTGAQPEPESNLSRDLLKRWKNPGDESRTSIPALPRGKGSINITSPDNYSTNWMYFWNNSDVRVVDASFLRCQQLNLTWNMNRDLCKRYGFQTLSLSAIVNNLFVIASDKLQGYDPELLDSTHPGVIPPSYSFGISVGF